MQRGQTVLEFLFLLLIIIIYLTTLIIPMSKDAQSAINDTEKLARANNETQKIANAIEKVSLLGNASRATIDVFVPEDTNISCSAGQLSFNVQLTLKPFPAQCDNTGKCTKNFALQNNSTLNCGITLPAYTKTSVKVEKSGSTVTVSEAG